MSIVLSLTSNSVPNLNLAVLGGRFNTSSRPLGVSRLNERSSGIVNQGLFQREILGRQIRKTVAQSVMGDLLGATPPPSSPTFPAWATWILGTVITLILPVWKMKGGFWGKIGKTVEELAETVAETVEDVADAVEKISSEVADKLPEDGKLKDAASWVEDVSKEVAEDARQTLDFIHKVEGVAEEAENLDVPLESQSEETTEKDIQGTKEEQPDGKKNGESGFQEKEENGGNDSRIKRTNTNGKETEEEKQTIAEKKETQSRNSRWKSNEPMSGGLFFFFFLKEF